MDAVRLLPRACAVVALALLAATFGSGHPSGLRRSVVPAEPSAPAPAVCVAPDGLRAVAMTQPDVNAACPAPPSPTGTRLPGFPTASSVGVPADWVPSVTRGTWTISAPGVYSDVRVEGDIQIRSADVVLRRVQVVGGVINNEDSGRCYSFAVEDSSVVQSGKHNNAGTTGVIGPGGYTARRVAIVDRVEGFRVGGRSSGCGAVVIEDSYVRIAPPKPCGDWHGDGIQGYDAPPATYRNITIELIEDRCGGNAPFFYGNAGNAAFVVDRMLVSGGGYPFRTDTAAAVTGLRVVDGTWTYAPIDYEPVCGRSTVWRNNAVSDPAGHALRPIVC